METILQVHHDMRRACRIDVVEHVQFVPAREHAVDGGLRNGDLVHIGLPLSWSLAECANGNDDT
jgi:hypothetical protein